jgi:hypothetical protein
MLHTRRRFLASSTAALAAAPLVSLDGQTGKDKADASSEAILVVFKSLPGETAVKI